MATSLKRITGEQTVTLKNEFFRELGVSNAKQRAKPFLIVIGGAPGSGKTAIADILSYVSGSYHVQANSARYLLGKHGFDWGENVHLVIRAVLEEILPARRWAVTLDGMLMAKSERQLIKKIAAKHNTPVLFNAVLCQPEIAEERARKRYADGKPSEFHDWRCNPERFEEYVTGIYSRTALLKGLVSRALDNPGDRIQTINNNGAESDTIYQAKLVWEQIKEKL